MQYGLVNVTMETDLNTTVMNMTRLSCEEAQKNGLPLPLHPTTASVIRYLQITYFIVSFLIGLFLNTLLVVLVARYKKLQNLTFALPLQIVTIDAAHTIIIYPTATASAIIGRLPLTSLCSTLGFFLTFLRLSRGLLMSMLVFDRFCTVYMPFWYNRNRTKVVIATSLSAWTLAMAASLPLVSGLLDCYSFQRFTWTCVIGEGCSHPAVCATYRTIVTTTVVGSLFVAFLLYGALLRKAKKIRNRVTTISNEIQTLDDHTTEEAREAARKKKIRERNANTTFFIMFVTLVGVSFFSYFFFNFGGIALRSLKLSPPPPAYIILAIIARSLFVMLVIMDPLVILRNPEVREVLSAITRKIKRRVIRERETASRIETRSSLHQ